MDVDKRVIYRHNPLLEVILQIKFPTILSINAKDPVDFQDAIRQDYPIYQLSIEKEQEINFAISADKMQPSITQRQQNKNHAFISGDGQYKINLTSGFISISTVGYKRWEDLLSRFEKPLEKFLELYAPSFLERIGLRYIDAFSRQKLKIEDKKWSDLIQPAWLGPIAHIGEEKTLISACNVEYLLDNGVSRAKVHTGLGNIQNTAETVFIVDSDFIHIKNEEPKAWKDIVDYLHNQSGRFIRSVITDNLHEAMIPEELQ